MIEYRNMWDLSQIRILILASYLNFQKLHFPYMYNEILHTHLSQELIGRIKWDFIYIYTYICIYIYKHLTYDDNEHVLLLSPMAFLVPDSNFQLSIFWHSCLLGSYLQLHASCIISWFLLSSYFWFSPAQILGFWKILTLDCLPSSDPWLHLAPQILNFVQILSLSPYAGIYDLVQLWSWYWQTESQLTMRFRVSKCSYFHGDHTQKSPKISVYGHIKKNCPFETPPSLWLTPSEIHHCHHQHSGLMQWECIWKVYTCEGKFISRAKNSVLYKTIWESGRFFLMLHVIISVSFHVYFFCWFHNSKSQVLKICICGRQRREWLVLLAVNSLHLLFSITKRMW